MSDSNSFQQSYQTLSQQLLDARGGAQYWQGELSTSALSTATAVMAFEMVKRECKKTEAKENEYNLSQLQQLIDNGIIWLVNHQNEDGGWGDTVKSLSNISTTMLSHATLHAAGNSKKNRDAIKKAKAYIDDAGGVPALIRRYGKDKTFSIPILTHCAIAGLVEWKQVSPLPFELACLPHRFYRTIRMPVVSYALPALIAIGQVRHHFRKTWNPITRLLRHFAYQPSLEKLSSIQPTNGGFLEAAPLTSFVTMSLAAIGLIDHPVVQKGIQFLIDSARDDGSFPIDTNLATWVSTLSINALEDDLPEENKLPLLEWLLNQQYKEVHPYTHAAPGGWAWTDLPGGVPDADDTPGAMLALLNLTKSNSFPQKEKEVKRALAAGIGWLQKLQNRDGGFPTFCRGWGTLPFDRSAPDLTAHAIRAIHAWQQSRFATDVDPAQMRHIDYAIKKGFEYLEERQRQDGSWLPLWFGNQFAINDENPVYGTSRVLMAYRDTGNITKKGAQKGLNWLRQNQNEDGGWGGIQGTPSSVEETALATEALLAAPDINSQHDPKAVAGLKWLQARINNGTITETSPIGFYFAKLWYFEELYPLIFATSALRRGR